MVKVALVTAGGSGMGADSARALAKDGYKVGILSSSGKGETLAKELGGVGITGTNKSENDIKKIVDTSLEKWGRIDVLVNSAVHGPRAPILELTDQDWHEGMEVYFLSAVRPSRLVTPIMQKQRNGVIINISSVAGLRAGTVGGVAYNASKFGMSALGITVAEEHRELGIRVTNIYPGEVETPILDNRPVPVSAEHRARILQPEDCADAVMMVVRLPARANIPELVIIPTTQSYK